MTFSADDARHMARALRLAERGLYTTDPNPRVGSVIVKDGQLVGEGAHLYAGEPHAEVHALRAAGAAAQGATAYITLEPCCHFGRTPPCTQALIEAGVARVVAAMEDPNPRVAGQGLAQLRAAGIAAEAGLMAGQAAALNPGFISRMQRGRPYIRAKIAASLDGRTALANGTSKWITGEAARADVQRQRARSSAIMTGIGTVVADDPSLDVRAMPVRRQPLRIVIDRRLRMPATARMLGLDGTTLVAAVEGAPRPDLERAGAEILPVGARGDSLDFAVLMRQLAAREVNEILVEAGPGLCGALLQWGLIDELVLYLAPHLLGSAARGMFDVPVLAEMRERVALDIKDIRAVGEDWRITAAVRYAE